MREIRKTGCAVTKKTEERGRTKRENGNEKGRKENEVILEIWQNRE